MKAFYDADIDLSHIKKKKVAVIGYGSQGHAHALNLKESGVNVASGFARTALLQTAIDAGLKVMDVAEAADWGDVIMTLVPDELAPEIFKKESCPGLTPGKHLAGGARLRPALRNRPPSDVSVWLVAPKAPGHTVGANTRAAAAFRCCSPSTKIPPAIRGKWGSRTRAPSAAGAPASSRPVPRGDRDRSLRRAGGALRRAHLAHSRRASRPYRSRVRPRKWPISSAFTSSS